MIITNKILSLSGQGLSPESGDATVQIPNTLLPIFSPRSPLTSLLTTAPAEPLNESHAVAIRTNQPGALPQQLLPLTRLGAGLWHVNISYSIIATPAFLVADNIAGVGDGVRLRNPNASQSILLFPTFITSLSVLTREFTLNLPSDGWDILFLLPATIAGQTVAVSATVLASRLT